MLRRRQVCCVDVRCAVLNVPKRVVACWGAGRCGPAERARSKGPAGRWLVRPGLAVLAFHLGAYSRRVFTMRQQPTPAQSQTRGDCCENRRRHGPLLPFYNRLVRRGVSVRARELTEYDRPRSRWLGARRVRTTAAITAPVPARLVGRPVLRPCGGVRAGGPVDTLTRLLARRGGTVRLAAGVAGGRTPAEAVVGRAVVGQQGAATPAGCDSRRWFSGGPEWRCRSRQGGRRRTAR